MRAGHNRTPLNVSKTFRFLNENYFLGLDPADPAFTGMPLDKRLDASDADFVDVIHTDASKFILVSGE